MIQRDGYRLGHHGVPRGQGECLRGDRTGWGKCRAGDRHILNSRGAGDAIGAHAAFEPDRAEDRIGRAGHGDGDRGAAPQAIAVEGFKLRLKDRDLRPPAVVVCAGQREGAGAGAYWAESDCA